MPAYGRTDFFSTSTFRPVAFCPCTNEVRRHSAALLLPGQTSYLVLGRITRLAYAWLVDAPILVLVLVLVLLPVRKGLGP